MIDLQDKLKKKFNFFFFFITSPSPAGRQSRQQESPPPGGHPGPATDPSSCQGPATSSYSTIYVKIIFFFGGGAKFV